MSLESVWTVYTKNKKYQNTYDITNFGMIF